MHAGVDQGEPAAQGTRVAFPEHDRVVGPGDPLPVGGVNVHGRVERVRPLDHRAVEVRVADRDRADPAQFADPREHVVVDVGDHVPEHVAAGDADQQGTLADRGRRGSSLTSPWCPAVASSASVVQR